MERGLFANEGEPPGVGAADVVSVGAATLLALIAHILAAMLAFWMALRIEILNPPDTSVPNPT